MLTIRKRYHRSFQAKSYLFLLSPSAELQSLFAGTMVRLTAVCVLPTRIVWQLTTMGPARLLGSSLNTVLWPSVLL